MRPDPVDLRVMTPAGETSGAVQPTSRVEAFSTTDVTFYIPLEGEWRITGNLSDLITSVESAELDDGCTVIIDLQPTFWGWRCEDTP